MLQLRRIGGEVMSNEISDEARKCVSNIRLNGGVLHPLSSADAEAIVQEAMTAYHEVKSKELADRIIDATGFLIVNDKVVDSGSALLKAIDAARKECE